MSVKAARGTKRVCQSCGGKFYDLNRDPIICPLCQGTYHQEQSTQKAAMLAGNAADDDDDDIVSPTPGVEIVSLDEVADDENLPDLDGDELIEDDGELPDDDDETFIQVEDDEGDDVTGIVGGSLDGDDDI